MAQAHTSTGTVTYFCNDHATPGYYGGSAGPDAGARPAPEAAGPERRIVPCNVCFLYPTNPELTNVYRGTAWGGMAFCWPCIGRRLNTVIDSGSRLEHREILWEVNFIRSLSEAWRLEVDSTAEGAALRVATLYAQRLGLEVEEASEYICSNIRELLVALSQETPLNMRLSTMDVSSLLGVPMQLLDDTAVLAVANCLWICREANFWDDSEEFSERVVFTPPQSCAAPRDGWSSSATQP